MVAVILSLAATLLIGAITRHAKVAAWLSLTLAALMLGGSIFWFILLAGLAILPFQWWHRRQREPLIRVPAAALIVPSAGMLIIAFLNLFATGVVARQDFSLPGAAPTAAAVTVRPSIYVALLDGYPRADELQAAFGIDNSSFLDSLQAEGFEVVPDARTIFPGTALTMASSMLADPTDLIPHIEITEHEELLRSWRYVRRNYLTDEPMMDRLREAGYRLRHIWSDVTLSRWRGWDETIDTGQLNDIEAVLIQRSPLAPLLGGWVMQQRRDRIEQSLAAWTASVGPSQVVSFLHLMAPHPPFLWGRDGALTQPLQCWYELRCELATIRLGDMDLTEAQYGDRLGWQLEAVNERVLASVRDLIEAEPDAIIILMSDHGGRWAPRNEEWHHSLLATRNAPELDGPDALFVKILEAVE